MNKKKNVNKKKILLIGLPLVLLAIIVFVAIAVNKSNNEKVGLHQTKKLLHSK